MKILILTFALLALTACVDGRTGEMFWCSQVSGKCHTIGGKPGK